MISIQEFTAKSGYTPDRQIIYHKRLEDFQNKYTDKTIYTHTDIKQYCNGSQRLRDEMNVIARYLKLNFQLIGKETEKPVKHPLDVMMKKYLLYLKRRDYASKTIHSYGGEFKVFKRFCSKNGISHIETIDKNVINSYKDWLYRSKNTKGEYYDVTSQAKFLQRLRSFFSWLVKEEYISVSPCMHLTIPREHRKISRNLFTRNELDDFFSMIDTDNVYGFVDRTMFELFYATGMRTSELLNLKLKHINLEDGLITIFDGKGRKDRTCILTIIARRYLEVYLDKVRSQYLNDGYSSEYVFPTVHGKIQDKKWISERIDRYRNLANIQHQATCYAFRRSFATHLLQEGVNIRYIQRLMGHLSIRTTLRYIHITLKDLRNVLLKHHPREKSLSNKKIAFRGTG